MDYLLKNELLNDDAEEIAHFLHMARPIDWQKKREYLQTRCVLDMLLMRGLLKRDPCFFQENVKVI